MARKYDHEYKVQAVKLAKEIGGAKAAKELGIPEGTIHMIIPGFFEPPVRILRAAIPENESHAFR